MHLKAIISLLEQKLSPKLFKLDSEVYGIQYGISDPNRVIKQVLVTLKISLEDLWELHILQEATNWSSSLEPVYTNGI